MEKAVVVTAVPGTAIPSAVAGAAVAVGESINWALVILYLLLRGFLPVPVHSSQIKCKISSSGQSESSFMVNMRFWTLENVFIFFSLSQVFSAFLSPR